MIIFKENKIFSIHCSIKIPKEWYENYECIGFHMTDLPYGRGGTPLQNLILLGKKTTVISAFRITEEMDAGPIYLKTELPLFGSAREIYERAYNIIQNFMIPTILADKIEPVPQKGEVVEFSRVKGSVDLSKNNNISIYDAIRMTDADGYPKAYIDIPGYRIEFIDAIDGDEVRAKVCFKKR